MNNPILLTLHYGPYVAVEHLQSGCLVGLLRCLSDAENYSAMIRPWLRNVTSYDDMSAWLRRALAIQLAGWYALYNYPPYSHCPVCNQWAVLCEGHTQ